MAGTAHLQAVLADEVDAVSRFVGLLRSEMTALQSGTADNLPELLASKASVAEQLATLARTRNELLAKAGLAADREGITALISSGPYATPEYRTLVGRLLELAREARDVNQLNGQLIAIRMNHAQAAIAALGIASPVHGLYGRDGQSSSAVGYRIIDSA